MLLFLCIKTPLPRFCPIKNGINGLQTKTREEGNMQFLKFTATAMDKEWIEGNKDRETYREHKEEICDRTEGRNEGKEDFFFLTEIRGARIKGAALVTDDNLYRLESTFTERVSGRLHRRRRQNLGGYVACPYAARLQRLLFP